MHSFCCFFRLAFSFFLLLFRNRIIAARIEGVASQYPPHTHQRPFDDAKTLYSGIGIMRAGWRKTALRRRSR